MARGRLITVDDEVFEIVAEAPGRTSFIAVNRTKRYESEIADLERRKAAIAAALSRVRSDAGQEQRRHGRRRTDNLDLHPPELRSP